MSQNSNFQHPNNNKNQTENGKKNTKTPPTTTRFLLKGHIAGGDGGGDLGSIFASKAKGNMRATSKVKGRSVVAAQCGTPLYAL